MSDDSRTSEAGGLHGFLEAMYGRVFRGIATVGLPPSFIVVLEAKGRRSGKRTALC